jgi:hypothetical protein
MTDIALEIGDYVLATKYDDGDVGDQIGYPSIWWFLEEYRTKVEV